MPRATSGDLEGRVPSYGSRLLGIGLALAGVAGGVGYELVSLVVLGRFEPLGAWLAGAAVVVGTALVAWSKLRAIFEADRPNADT